MRIMDGRSIIDIKWSEEAGIGCTRKCLYRGDGAHFTMEDGVDEDRVISYRVNDIHLYCIFDGHDGSKASQFAAQQFPLELLMGQLEDPSDDKELQNVIETAFQMVEEKFFDSLEEAANSPQTLTMSPLQPMNHAKPASSQHVLDVPDYFAGGSTVVMAVYCHGKLFFANCGDSVAVLCKLNPEGVLMVHPVGLIHNIDSEDEALRLSLLGLDVSELKRQGSLKLTRCIGNYALKKYYRTFEALRTAVTSPIICDPEIIGGVPVNQDMRGFIYLMSGGLHKSWLECTGSQDVEGDIAKLIAHQLSSDKSLHDVAQAVLEEVCSRHAAVYAAGGPQSYCRRDEMTLLIRNFGLDRNDVKIPQQQPPRTASAVDVGTLTASTLYAPPNLRRTASDNNIGTCESLDSDSGMATNNYPRSIDTDGFLEFVDPYVSFSELDSLDAEYDYCSDSD